MKMKRYSVIITTLVFFLTLNQFSFADTRREELKKELVRLEKLEQSCQKGDAKACAEIAWNYKSLEITIDNEKVFTKNPIKAVQYAGKACNDGEFNSCYDAASGYYFESERIELNPMKAIKFAEKGCWQSKHQYTSITNCTLLGAIYMDYKEYNSAIKPLKTPCATVGTKTFKHKGKTHTVIIDSGKDACVLLGTIYAGSTGNTRNISEAIRLYNEHCDNLQHD
ncbi:MAG: sel1 repeat family protein, partial [Neisseriaceae bacterium]|nr:sel1 repeat family protein [Neisseriaceae bacterium]